VLSNPSRLVGVEPFEKCIYVSLLEDNTINEVNFKSSLLQMFGMQLHQCNNNIFYNIKLLLFHYLLEYVETSFEV